MPLHGKKGLIAGIANEHSIAYGCAKVLRSAGAELGVTYLNAKAEPYVRPLAEQLESSIIVPCDVREPGQLEAVFSLIKDKWGRLDFLLHSIAYAPKEDLHSRVIDCSQNLMGLVKAALESSVRYMAAELGTKCIRVHALSPGPLKTHAASGIERFDELLERARSRAPQHRLVSIEDVGNLAAFLVSDAGAALTGNVEYIDAGYHIIG
jgi:enoyl-[acyl-carrier protein] reductase I